MRLHYYGSDEISDIAFSELYTRAQSLSRVLAVCDVNCKVLNSLELCDLLYVAYNRDESDIFSVDKAVTAGYDSLYTTAPDVLDKKKKILDKKIQEDAFKKANDAVENARIKSKKQKEIEEQEKNMDKLIEDMAKIIIEQNMDSLTDEIAKSAIAELENSKDKEGKEDVQEERKTKTRRNTKRTESVE